jgi:N6-adenosine-specific RNA methylase IME4
MMRGIELAAAFFAGRFGRFAEIPKGEKADRDESGRCVGGHTPFPELGSLHDNGRLIARRGEAKRFPDSILTRESSLTDHESFFARILWGFQSVSICMSTAASDLLDFVGTSRFATILADPPWQFVNRTGKIAPEHRRLSRYDTMDLEQIKALPVSKIAAPTAHLYLWVPNALLPDGLAVMAAWGFKYKSNLVWHKVRKDGGSDGRGVGFYFRNVTELILFGVRGKNARTLAPARSQVNLMATRKREHSRKPDEQYGIIQSCSRGPYLELFARGLPSGWIAWGNQATRDYHPNWPTYPNHTGDIFIPASAR